MTILLKSTMAVSRQADTIIIPEQRREYRFQHLKEENTSK
jgi:hypothetical protein